MTFRTVHNPASGHVPRWVPVLCGDGEWAVGPRTHLVILTVYMMMSYRDTR